ncbi:NAD-dependent epimerase/dehydratase family protein [Streptomyces sp. ACA25]|uniref:NAD-dependent epimerase/dehydratase family protein n=1 Tax=Streptomyces sp. ACA25 TaxID=3022596 RepID=UPI002307D27B|nr:NAD-dependent epimerase/dehydratase family protein [Streptomyces sp. ACA25]MDB1086614.1 NAD-dependent epimerase/dehydratase family protein [Streptomyces sp. ACA25]
MSEPDAASRGLRVVVVGATGNVGSSLVQTLSQDSRVASVLGLARRLPDWPLDRTAWARVDLSTGSVAEADLTGYFRAADAVVHLGWLMQPTHDPLTTWRTNVLGTVRVLNAVAAAGVPALIHASSVGAYSPGPKDRPVTESYPTHGWPQAAYTREKAYLERVLDIFARDHPRTRVVRMRPGFIFKRESAMQQRRLFMGPLLPHRLVRSSLLPFVPDLPGLRLQVLHTSDAADAYRQAVVRDVRGAFNVAAGPVVDAEMLARILGARTVPVYRPLVRGAVAAAWHARLLPASPQLFDAMVRMPVMDTTRAMDELGWSPRYTAEETLTEFLHGLREGAGMDTPTLTARLPGGRLKEMATGVGGRD